MRTAIKKPVELNPVMSLGKFTRQEIFSQPEAWSQAIESLKETAAVIKAFSRLDQYQQAIFTGCGSTYYLSQAAAAQFQAMTRMPARGLPASELWLSPQAYYPSAGETLLVAISRSGETSETLQACEAFRAGHRGKIITLVCNPESALAQSGDLNLVYPSGMEKSIAQTRAFSTLLLGVIGTLISWTDGNHSIIDLEVLPQICRQLLENNHSLAKKLGQNTDFDRIYFLGSAERHGLARELSLKMKEMCLTHSESFHFMEFRHGPKAMVNNHTLVIGLVSDSNSNYELSVLRDVKNLGAETISIGEHDLVVSFNSGLKEVYRNVLYLPFGQMMAHERAMAKGLDPDHPTNLDAVVILPKK